MPIDFFLPGVLLTTLRFNFIPNEYFGEFFLEHTCGLYDPGAIKNILEKNESTWNLLYRIFKSKLLNLNIENSPKSSQIFSPFLFI